MESIVAERDAFARAFFDGKISKDKLCEAVERYVEFYAKSKELQNMSLAEFLGFTQKEYSEWTKETRALPRLFEEKARYWQCGQKQAEAAILFAEFAHELYPVVRELPFDENAVAGLLHGFARAEKTKFSFLCHYTANEVLFGEMQAHGWYIDGIGRAPLFLTGEGEPVMGFAYFVEDRSQQTPYMVLRTGKPLTKEELFEAYEAQEHLYDVQNVTAYLNTLMESGDLGEELHEEAIEEIAYSSRKIQDDSETDMASSQEAITDAYDDWRYEATCRIVHFVGDEVGLQKDAAGRYCMTEILKYLEDETWAQEALEEKDQRALKSITLDYFKNQTQDWL